MPRDGQHDTRSRCACESLERRALLAIVAPVTQLRNNGPSDNRVDVVLLGDGYTEADLPTYRANADTIQQGFFTHDLNSPVRMYEPLFNVFRVDVVSNQSGTDNDPSEGILRDTALGMGFASAGSRSINIDSTTARSYAANAPGADLIIAMANSSTYG